MSTLDQNLDLARRCIDHLKGLQIKSVNKPTNHIADYATKTVWNWFQHDMKLCYLDYFVFGAMRYNWKAEGDQEKRKRRDAVLTVLRARCFSPADKKRLLNDFMTKWGFDCFKNKYGRPTLHPDENRIRSARRAIKFGFGNCGEKSAICATWLLENCGSPDNILWIAANPEYDHVFVVLGAAASHWCGDFSNLNEEAVVVDGWTEDFYQARSWKDVRQGVHVPSPFQLLVRKRVADNSPTAKVQEEVHLHKAGLFAPAFRLALASQPAGNYKVKVQTLDTTVVNLTEVGTTEKAPSGEMSEVIELLEVMNEPDLIIDEIIDLQAST